MDVSIMDPGGTPGNRPSRDRALLHRECATRLDRVVSRGCALRIVFGLLAG
jgi:hypothetical protein